ncbi:MAG: hypothetical protein WCV80_00585 [Candidatus Paceibacterota bacterium]
MNLFKERTFKWWEIGLIKVCLLSLGALLGIYFYDFFMSLAWLLCTLFIATGFYFIVRFIKGR